MQPQKTIDFKNNYHKHLLKAMADTNVPKLKMRKKKTKT